MAQQPLHASGTKIPQSPVLKNTALIVCHGTVETMGWKKWHMVSRQQKACIDRVSGCCMISCDQHTMPVPGRTYGRHMCVCVCARVCVCVSVSLSVCLCWTCTSKPIGDAKSSKAFYQGRDDNSPSQRLKSASAAMSST